MTRLQKKCLVLSAAFHGLLAAVLIFGPASMFREENPLRASTLRLVPAQLIAQAFAGGAPVVSPSVPRATRALPRHSEPTVPSRPSQPPPRRQPAPEHRSAPPVRRPRHRPTARRTDSQPSRAQVQHSEPKPKPARHPAITPDMHLRRRQTDVDSRVEQAIAREREAARRRAEEAAQKRRNEIRQAAQRINAAWATQTTIDIPDGGGSDFAAYGQLIIRVYQNRWVEPSEVVGDSFVVNAEVVIRRDGRVVSARIAGGSGNAMVDRSVQDVLQNVKWIAPFPPGTQDEQRTFHLAFDLKTRR